MSDRLASDWLASDWLASDWLASDWLPSDGLRRIGLRPTGRRLSEGEVFRESRGGEALPGAVEEHQEGAPRGVWPPGAGLEEGGDSGAFESFLECRGLVRRLGKQDRHPVEGDPVGRLGQEGARVLDRLRRRPRRGDYREAPAPGARIRPPGGEQVALRGGDGIALRGVAKVPFGNW